MELREVFIVILSDVCHLDDEGKRDIQCKNLFTCLNVSTRTGKEAWEKFLDIMYNVIFECLDGRSDQFF